MATLPCTFRDATPTSSPLCLPYDRGCTPDVRPGAAPTDRAPNGHDKIRLPRRTCHRRSRSRVLDWL